MVIEDIPIVIPEHRDTLGELDLHRIRITMKFNKRIIFVLPNSRLSEFRKRYRFEAEYVGMPDSWFLSINTYNSLLLSEYFWKRFESFSEIVICQTDAILIKNVNILRELPFAYLGASWKPKKCRFYNGRLYEDYRKQFFLPYKRIEVGNGGLSFRKVSESRQLVELLKGSKKMKEVLSGKFNEDIVFSYFFQIFGFSLPKSSFADSIFVESKARGMKHVPNVFGFHALNRFNPGMEELIIGSL